MGGKKCKRGNVAERDKFGHCLCPLCKSHHYKTQINNPNRKEYVKIWRKKNKDKVASYTKKWNEENKEQRREIVNNWKKKNPEKVKKYWAKASKKWSQNNKGRKNASDMKRKAAKIQRTPKWADLEKIKLFYIEAHRLTIETGIPYEVDHIIPLQGENVSGLHVHNNLQIILRSKNRSKKNKYNDIIWKNIEF